MWMVKLKRKKVYIISSFLSATGMCLIFFLCGVYPMGNTSNLASDLYFQYIDYFGWFRNVLLGYGKIDYSFSMSLGNQTVGQFAYYLSSPFNLLVYFFSEEQLPLFVFLITVLKITLCAIGLSYYARKRFSKCKDVYIIIASVSYALMQYNMAQITNIMWLDGVYMLPFILAGVYRYVEQKKYKFFCAMIFLTILFNWYTAYMNCLFAVLYYMYECLLVNEKGNVFKYIKKIIFFCLYELLGVLSSSFFFIPVIFSMIKGKAGFGLEGIFQIKLNGSIYEFLKGFFIGNYNSGGERQLGLYCGYIVFVFLLVYFTNKSTGITEKIYSAIFLLIMFLSGYVFAIENVWNGFRRADSYYCRFGYLIIFTIIYLGLKGMATYKDDKQNLAKMIGILAVAFEAYYLYHPLEPIKIVITMTVFSLYLLWTIYSEYKFSTLMICIILLLELTFNGYYVRNGNYTSGDISAYKKYTTEESKLIDTIKSLDTSEFYRLEQTLNRQSEGDIATFNDSMVYNYHGFSNYTSTINSDIVDFMVDMGYYDGEHYIMPYREPILAADSFMGIKYLMSPIGYPGFKLMENIEARNEKRVYYNPYALGLGMGVSGKILDPISNSNPFVFQNKLYSFLLGEDIVLYKKINCKSHMENEHIIYDISSINEQGIIYAYAETPVRELGLYVDDKYRCEYNRWLSYKTFNVGNANEDHQIRFEKYNDTAENMNLELYYFDLEAFKKVIDQLNQNTFKVSKFEDGDVEGDFYSDKAGYLLLTVPYDDGWKIQVNNSKVTAQRGGNTFLVIPVEQGENNIKLHYRIPGVVLGIIISLISFSLVFLHKRIFNIYLRRKRKSLF